MGFIKYRLVDMYNCHLFQVESLKEYKRGKVFISFVNNENVIYKVDVGSFAFIDFKKTDNAGEEKDYTYFQIRFDGDDKDRRNEIKTIDNKLTELDKKIFHKSIEIYVREFNNILNEDTSPRLIIDINSI